MEHDFTEKELNVFWQFLTETFKLNETQLAAVDRQIAMSQELFDQIIDKCEEVGSDLDGLFFRMLREYPEFMVVRAEQIEKDIKDFEIPTFSEEEKEAQKQKLFERIRAEYGEDAI